MGSTHSNPVQPEEPKAPGTTTLWGSWDKPVADAYAEKQQQSKQSIQPPTDSKGAADAAPQSSVQLIAGAGLNPAAVPTTTAAGLKSAGIRTGWLLCS